MSVKNFLIAAVAGLFFCLFSSPALSLAEDYEIVWKSGTLVPKGVGYATQIQKILIPDLLKATDGKVYLKVYYGGVMGDDEDYLKKMRIGQLQGTGTSVQGALLACPELGVVNLPLVFNNWEEVDHIKKTMYPSIDGILQSKGFKLILWLDQGFDQIYSIESPLENLGEFKKTRFLTWCGPIEEKFLEVVGAQAVPVNAPELNSSLRAGVAKAYIGPPIWAVSTQMYSVIKYISALDIRYSPSVFIVTKDAWDQLTPQHQKNIMASREEWQTKFCLGSREDNDKCLEAMFKYGVAQVKMTPETIKELRSRVKPLYEELADDLYPMELLEELNENLADFRGE